MATKKTDEKSAVNSVSAKPAEAEKAAVEKAAEPAAKATTVKTAAAKTAAAKTTAAKTTTAKAATTKTAAKPATTKAAATKTAATAKATEAKTTAAKAAPAKKTVTKAAASTETKATTAKATAAKTTTKATAAKATADKPADAEPTTAKATAAKTTAAKATATKATTAKATADKVAEAKETAAQSAATKKTTTTEVKASEPAEKTAAKPAEKATATKKATTAKKSTSKAASTTKKTAASKETTAKKAATTEAATAKKTETKKDAAKKPAAPEPAPVQERELPQPRRSVAFIGSECYPFVKTGGLGDVMYALPKALVDLNCDVKVILPNYGCISDEYKEKMVYRGSFYMDLTSDGQQFYVGIMEYVWDGVVYDFIDNEEFFTRGNPYTNLVDDISVFTYFSKAALSALNYMDWIPDVIHCHDWQASLVPIFLRTMFASTELSRAKVVTTIHNLRFQGQYNIPTLKYWSNLPDEAFSMGALQEDWTEANMLKGGIAYSDAITTVSHTYAAEIQTPEYGEGLQQHLSYHSYKLRGIVNGIDYDVWNPATDKLLEAPYSVEDAIEKKKANKLALQRALGLEEDPDKFVVSVVSRLTGQKGLDLVSTVLPGLLDGFTQVVILGTGEPELEGTFRYYEEQNKGTVCAYIAYDESISHKVYAGSDALLMPSRFEPCGLTQLIGMHYGAVPVVRETGGLKDTVEPYNMFDNTGNGYTFDRFDAGLLYDAINRAKTLYFEDREDWDKMVIRDMEKDVSWTHSAEQYRWLYLDLTM